MTFSINENAFSRRREGTTSMSSSTMEPGSSKDLPWKNTGAGGAFEFYGNTNSNIIYKNMGNGEFNLGTGDWTIEWWQYETDTNGSPRPWAFGPWPDTQLGISFENNIYVWRWGSNVSFNYQKPVKNTSNHFAMVKQNNYLTLYQNGVWCGQVEDTYGYDLGYNLTIGYEGGQYDSQCFAGTITNFNIVNYAKYTGPFTPTNTALTFEWNTNVFLAPFDNGQQGAYPVGPYFNPTNQYQTNVGNANWVNVSPFKFPHPEFPAPPATAVVSGGTKYVVNEYTYRAFTASDLLTISGGTLNFEYISIAGGGGGANGGGGVRGGGGGAGGFLQGSVLSCSPGQYAVVVGSGGPAGAYGAQNGGFGSDSYILAINGSTAIGGGGGGRDSYAGNWANGNAGGSGGGGGGLWTNTSGGSSVFGQGNNGGPGYAGGNGGGGGGIGSAGNNPDGGWGTDLAGWHIDNVLSTTWVAEGGGGANGGSGHISGGSGGANGGVGSTAIANTGSGGGGGYGPGGNTSGGNGASGLVLVRYLTSDVAPLPTVSGGTTTSDGQFYYTTFTSSGTFSVANGSLVGAEALQVAGGGGGGAGGGYESGGGGGAGGVVHMTDISMSPGNYPVVVGSGGSFNSNGGDSYIDGLGFISYGGGFGGPYGGAGSGGSGGGAPGWGAHNQIGYGTMNQGHDGGYGSYSYSMSGSGGGGGATQKGYDAQNYGASGQGGSGTSAYDSWGAATNTGWLESGLRWYAAGGGGGSGWYNSVPAGPSGQGGTGNGSQYSPGNGAVNTGGGGGGSNNDYASAGSGGSGIIIIKYPVTSVAAVN